MRWLAAVARRDSAAAETVLLRPPGAPLLDARGRKPSRPDSPLSLALRLMMYRMAGTVQP